MDITLAVYYELRHGVKVIVGRLVKRDGKQVYIDLRKAST